MATVPALQERCGAANWTRSPKMSPSGKTLRPAGRTSMALRDSMLFRFANFPKHSYLDQVALNEAGVDSNARAKRRFLLARAIPC